MEGLTPHLLRALPDLPRWVEVRGMLLSGRGAMLQGAVGPPPAATVLQGDTCLGAVLGRPPAGALRDLARRAREILVVPEDAGWATRALARWSAEVARLHLWPESVRVPDAPDDAVRLLHPDEPVSLAGLPEPLRDELAMEAAAGSPMAAVFEGQRAAAFCYAGSVTETLWDVSIETLAPFRRRGYATRCFRFLARHMQERGRRPVWGAAASNVASAALARRLGFLPVDRLLVLSSPRPDPHARPGASRRQGSSR